MHFSVCRQLSADKRPDCSDTTRPQAEAFTRPNAQSVPAPSPQHAAHNTAEHSQYCWNHQCSDKFQVPLKIECMYTKKPQTYISVVTAAVIPERRWALAMTKNQWANYRIITEGVRTDWGIRGTEGGKRICGCMGHPFHPINIETHADMCFYSLNTKMHKNKD